MKNKNNLFKNICYAIFALCFLSAGIFSANLSQDSVLAEESTQIQKVVNNDIPDYFVATENTDGLISSDIFMYSAGASLSLSLKTNGSFNATGNPIYNYVYYPNVEDTTIFKFFRITSFELSINGNPKTNLVFNNFVDETALSFENKSETTLQTFEMKFGAEASNDMVDITEENDSVIEGLYTLKLNLVVLTCNNGLSDGSEDSGAFSDESKTIEYNFYVVDKENYLTNDIPNVERVNFDHEVSSPSTVFDYYTYYHYTGKDFGSKISYIEYDYLRYDIDIAKEHSNNSYGQSIYFDPAENNLKSIGDSVVSYVADSDTHKAKVYFYDVGNYTITYKDILVLDYTSETATTTQKHHLEGISDVTKKLLVYVFGFQANYTDMDGTPDANNVRPVEELKTYDFENTGEFSQSADITSEFVNYNTSGVFSINNIKGFIEAENITPVVTNQTPIKFISNGTLTNSSTNASNPVKSYIFSTTDISSNYSDSGITLNGEKLYSTQFNGQTEGAVGKYIYLISYNFSNYYSTSATRDTTMVFYQVFYFEISKDLPSIVVQTEDNEDVYSDSFINKDIIITDTTRNNPYNRDVEIRVYAQDFSDNMLSSFGGAHGVSLNSVSENGQLTLQDNAHYTIRMYYSSDITSTNILFGSKSGFFRSQYFTIDKTPVTGITATNVEEVINSTNYRVVSNLDTFTTNQNIVISWDDKASRATTKAYYRHFKIDAIQYYNAKNNLYMSAILKDMINQSRNNSYLPINYHLDMNATNNKWFEYKGNSKSQVQSMSVSSEYVLSDDGLYIVDVYDQAGNHSLEIFLIDYTTPLFALYNTVTKEYSLANGSVYISQQTNLIWSKYKSLYISNLNSNLFTNYNTDTITDDVLGDENLFKNYNNEVSKEIYDILYNRLTQENYMQYLSSSTSSVDTSVSKYSNLYLTIPINSTYYYLTESNEYEKRSGASNEMIPVDKECNYKVLIRDLSNTKYLTGANFAYDSVEQYTLYYSATQKIIVSFDDSEFKISYDYTEKGQTYTEYLTSNNAIEDKDNSEKTTYLNPTRLSKAFELSFTPTKNEGDITIQVAKVTIKYYPYITSKIENNGIYYFYYELSNSATEIPVYEYSGTSQDSFSETIRLNYDGVTMAGKYEITRIYAEGDGFSYNENDFSTRTFILYVDRNEVVTNSDLVSDDRGENSHLESLVGGDIFVSMYDNKINSSLVVTFPNSADGNTNGSSIYNNGQARTILTTNMLPVSIYVPQYKYTINAEKVVSGQYSYHYNVTNNDKMNIYDTNKNNKIIREYALYAEIYYSETEGGSRTILASTVNSYNSTAYSTNGFLNFYSTTNGLKIDSLTTAGVYYVKIYQGLYGTETGINNYTQSLEFTFNILATKPDFTANTVAGAELNGETGSGDIDEIYYTNNSTISLTWNAGSDYMADIDIDAIKISTSTDQSFVGTSNNEIWISKPTLSNNTYIARISLLKLGVYSNNAYVDITMQYKNHNDTLYSKVTKRIVVDLSAPSTNVENLVTNSISGNLISSLTRKSLRTYYTANMEITNDLSKTSYNISNGTGNFAYYSYNVIKEYLNVLKNSNEYKIYVRKFVDGSNNCTKYKSEYEQETSPATFLASNFIEINKAIFDANCYYEIVELDKAENMSIYTIYIVDYAITSLDENNIADEDKIFTFTNADNKEQVYTKTNYNETNSYPGAIHSIYSKTGLRLEKINYFGDAWAQIKLVSTDSTISYLMLTPWDTTHAYLFSNGQTYTYEISSLIDGSQNSRFKSSISIYNRQNLTTDTFYINTRHTELVANLTDSQNREYIKFSAPTDTTINNTTFASTYLTSLKIKANSDILYEQTNRLGYASLWQSNDKITVNYDAALGTITFEVNADLGFAPNTKIIYEYCNNYGKTNAEVHLYRESIITTEISSENDLYAYYSANGTYFYVTQNGFQYYYNPTKYTVKVYDYIEGQKSEEETTKAEKQESSSNGIRLLTLYDVSESNYNDTFIIEVKDGENLIKSIYVTLYNQLPTINKTNETNKNGEFKLLDASRNNISEKIIESLSSSEAGYFSEVTLMYMSADTFIPIKYSFSEDRQTWTEVSSGTVFKNTSNQIATYYLKIWYDESYLKNEFGSSSYLFQNVPNSQIFEFNLSSLTSTFWVEKTVDGVTSIVERSNTIFKYDGSQYSNHYIVNLNYSTSESAVQIKTNTEQGILATPVSDKIENGNVVSKIWKISNESAMAQNIPAFSTFIVITYIPTSENFVQEFYTYNASGIIDTSDNLITKTSKSFVLSEESTTIRKIKLQWKKYNGIEQNNINISVVKDGTSITPTVYSENGYNYCYLSNSGKYLISLYDNAGNVQKFNYGNIGQTDKFTFIFLKDVPFTVTYTDPKTHEEMTSLPNKQAVYNSSVTLNIDNATRTDFYQVGGYPTIVATKNGIKLENSEITTETSNGKTKYIFTAPGTYEVYFVATSKLEGIGQIKTEKYQFTILNANEYRYSYIVNKYSDYYIEKIEKNGVDITYQLLSLLDVSKITVNQKTYLAELPLSYLDEKTGTGTYLITVNSNEKDFKSDYLPTSWTFQVIIKTGTAPISISVEEGKSTTEVVTIVYNKTNVYQSLGECSLRVIKYNKEGKYIGIVYNVDINETTTGISSTYIPRDEDGTFYVQVVSSDNLLYSYKIVKAEPMNFATIIIIIVGVILFIIIMIIVFRLRKKISVK